MSRAVKAVAALLLFALVLSVATAEAGEILLKKSFWWGWMYSTSGGVNYDKVGISGKELREQMFGHDEAIGEMRKYQSYQTWATITSGTGGAIIGWHLVDAIDEGWMPRHSYWFAGATVLLVVSSMLDEAATKHLKEAAWLYNRSHAELSLAVTGCSNLEPTAPRLTAGVTWRF